jgi:hypothetical protein
MLHTWNSLSLTVGDVLFGWLLRLPRDLTLFFIAVITVLVMMVVRRFTTNQDLLSRAAADGRRLRELIREARRARDRNALKRFRSTRSLLAVIRLKAELLPLLVSLLPIALLATWGLYRLEYLPVRPGTEVELALYTPVTDRDELVHIVSADGIQAADGRWVQRVEEMTDQTPHYGQAIWKLRAEGRAEPYTLTIRLKDRTIERELRVGQRTYAEPVVDHGDDYLSEWKREPYHFLGRVPGIAAIGMPAWLIGYVLLVVPLTFLFKRLLNLY